MATKSGDGKALADDLSRAIDAVDFQPPPELAVVLAAQQRQVLRNTAYMAHLNERLARKREAKEEAAQFAQQVNRAVRDIAAIDLEQPGAKTKMNQLDREVIARNVDIKKQLEQGR